MTESTAFESISKYAVSKVADKDAFNDLRTIAEKLRQTFPNDSLTQYESFNRECNEGETEFMEVNYANNPDAKHVTGKRNGQWKYRTYLPKAYSSAKCEIGKALEAGVDVTGLGKTAIKKERTSATKQERTVEEIIADYTGKLKRAIAGIDDPDERQRQRANAVRDISTL